MGPVPTQCRATKKWNQTTLLRYRMMDRNVPKPPWVYAEASPRNPKPREEYAPTLLSRDICTFALLKTTATSALHQKYACYRNKDLSSCSFCFAICCFVLFSLAIVRSAKAFFLRCSSSIFSSKLFSMMKRLMVTSRSCPNRCTRSTAWASAAGLNCGSITKALLALVRLRPCPPAPMETNMIATESSLSKASSERLRASRAMRPSRRTYV